MLGSVVLVGGSLTGLACAIGLGRLGLDVTLVEQSSGIEAGGTGLGVDRALLGALVGVDPRSSQLAGALPVVRTGRETSTWAAIYTWLRRVAEMTPHLSIREQTRITRVTQDDASATAWAGDVGITADVVLGADGYRSIVRGAVDAEHLEARYGGFVLWRALLPEDVVPHRFRNSNWLGGGTTGDARAARLIAYRVPGKDGSVAPGERQITLAWYDASRSGWMRDRGFVVDGAVRGSVDHAQIDVETLADLRAVGAAAWTAPANDVVLAAIDAGLLIGTPLAEYFPHRLARGRVAILGDAAHVSSPMVGHGLALGWLDGIALCEAIEGFGVGSQALAAYEQARLPASQRHVTDSMAATAELLASISQRV